MTYWPVLLKTVRLLGTKEEQGRMFGFLEGALVLGLILYVTSRYAFIENWFGEWLVNSQIAPFLLKFVDILLPLLPEVLKRLQSLIQ